MTDTQSLTMPEMKDGETVWWCPSRSRPGQRHTVDLEARNGAGACDCEDFRFRSGEPDFVECYHIEQIFRAYARHKLRETMMARGTLNQRTDGP